MNPESWLFLLLVSLCCYVVRGAHAYPVGSLTAGKGSVPDDTTGEGPVVVHFFHGWASSSRTWRPMLAHAPRWTRCYSYSAPFRGVEGPMDIVVGHSLGCFAALDACMAAGRKPPSAGTGCVPSGPDWSC